MKQTNQYGLNQWELSDQIRMEDFNADNAKIAAELARIRENIFDLAFYAGAENLWNSKPGQTSRRQFPVYSASFATANLAQFTCTGGAVLANDRVTLTGQGTKGSISTSRLLFVSPRRLGKSVRLWLHFKNGSVRPFLDNVEMTKIATFDDASPVGGYVDCTMYALDAPYKREFTLRLEMECGASSPMELYSIVLAQL